MDGSMQVPVGSLRIKTIIFFRTPAQTPLPQSLQWIDVLVIIAVS